MFLLLSLNIPNKAKHLYTKSDGKRGEKEAVIPHYLHTHHENLIEYTFPFISIL